MAWPLSGPPSIGATSWLLCHLSDSDFFRLFVQDVSSWVEYVLGKDGLRINCDRDHSGCDHDAVGVS